MVTSEFYARVTVLRAPCGRIAGFPKANKHPACRWLRSSSHNIPDQGCYVMQSLYRIFRALAMTRHGGCAHKSAHARANGMSRRRRTFAEPVRMQVCERPRQSVRQSRWPYLSLRIWMSTLTTPGIATRFPHTRQPAISHTRDPRPAGLQQPGRWQDRRRAEL